FSALVRRGVCRISSPAHNAIPMTSKERIAYLLRGDIPDRVGRVEAPWPETRNRWYREGLPAGVHANDHFVMDIRHLLKVDTSFQLPSAVLEDGPDYQVVQTSDGGTTKCWKHTGIPHPLSFGIASAEDWNRLRGHLTLDPNRFAYGFYGDYGYEYTADDIGRVQSAWRDCPNRRTTSIPFQVPEPIEGFLGKVGDETLLIWMATEPELLTDMFATHAAYVCRLLDLAISFDLRPDFLWIGGDIAYKNGLLFSPAMYRELLMPHHKTMIRHAHEHGLPVIYHTDGDCRAAIPLLIEAGIDCLQPMEVRAGLDVRELAPQYGDKIAFMGNISVENLAAGGEKMREELTEKVRFMAKNRYRYVYHSDHSLPDQVSLANFTEAMEIVEREGRY
ncbi:MAG: hypothetical protein K8T25_23325, partial [Planctomycetia bacterium]|nr:hypothetical protein [Planctomycetia bacterium]